VSIASAPSAKVSLQSAVMDTTPSALRRLLMPNCLQSVLDVAKILMLRIYLGLKGPKSGRKLGKGVKIFRLREI